MLAVELPSLVKVGLMVETLPSVDILELVVEMVVEAVLSVVDSSTDVVVIISVVLRGKLVVVRPGRRAHFETCMVACPCLT